MNEEQFMRKFQQRMKEISGKSIALTAALAKTNVYSIMKLSNASAPLHVKIPENEMLDLKDLLVPNLGDNNESN